MLVPTLKSMVMPAKGFFSMLVMFCRTKSVRGLSQPNSISFLVGALRVGGGGAGGQITVLEALKFALQLNGLTARTKLNRMDFEVMTQL